MIKLRRQLPFTSQSGLLVVSLTAAVGVVVVLLAAAAGSFATFEPENGTLANGATAVNVTGASGGKAAKFTAGTTPTPTPSPGGCPAGQVGTPPNCVSAPPVAAAAGKQWAVPFSEEFNGTDYNHSKLTPCFDWNYGDCTSSFNHGYEHYLPSQVTVSGGSGHLMAQPLSPPYADVCYNGSCTYKSGLLSTARNSGNDPATAYLYKFTYGYVEANLKAVNQQGFFVAWWMLPADPSYAYHYDASGTANPNGPFRYEIDILEMLGHDPTDMQMHYSWTDSRDDYYSPNDVGKNGACPDNVDYSQGFHRFGVDWEPTFLAFYIDGVKCGQYNATASGPVPNVPMQLILNQMVSVDWQRSIGKPLLNNTLTSDLQVDYIRVYQQVPAP